MEEGRTPRDFSARGRLARWLLPSPAYGKPGGMKRELWPLLVGFAYIAAIWLMGGIRPDHVFIGCLGVLDLYNETSRKFLRHFFPFILTGVLYDSMRYFYWPLIDGRVHVSGPYHRDLDWFGVQVRDALGARRVTPNEFFDIKRTIWLDLLCGFAYLIFVAEYLSTAFYLFLRNQMRCLWIFGWSFFTVNLMGWITYIAYPAAPPWFFAKYGLAPVTPDLKPDPAAAHRFDQILGTHFFDQIYGRNFAVYGAYPSLHVAYPLLVAWVSWLLPELKWFRLPAAAFYLLMCFSAVYLQHHYVVDLLLGTLYAVIVAAVVMRFVREPCAGEDGPAARELV